MPSRNCANFPFTCAINSFLLLDGCFDSYHSVRRVGTCNWTCSYVFPTSVPDIYIHSFISQDRHDYRFGSTVLLLSST